MRFSLFIALRYLFSKKKHSAINIVSMICAGGICVGTIALVCILSVYNGFQEQIEKMFSTFDPDIRIVTVQGKVFDNNDPGINKVKQRTDVQSYADVLEENAMIKCENKQTTVTVKGVSTNYTDLIKTDSIMCDGNFILATEQRNYGVVGVALAAQLNASLFMQTPLTLYAPKHDATVDIGNPESAFSEDAITLSGVYSVKQENADSRYIFVPIELARTLFGYSNQTNSALELNLKKGFDPNSVKKDIQKTVGNKFKVQDKKEQHEDFYRMLKVEKWITFLILTFILLIAIINVIGSLTMLIIEKTSDISTLRCMGADETTIRHIFVLEGWFTTAFGAILGVVIGLALCLLQEQYGLIKLGNGNDQTFIVDAYPVNVQAADIAAILGTVLILGFLVAWLPTRYIKGGTVQTDTKQ